MPPNLRVPITNADLPVIHALCHNSPANSAEGRVANLYLCPLIRKTRHLSKYMRIHEVVTPRDRTNHFFHVLLRLHELGLVGVSLCPFAAGGVGDSPSRFGQPPAAPGRHV